MSTASEFTKPPLWSRPLRIGPLEIPHRILMGSMHLGWEGHAQWAEQLAAFYRARVLGGAGLIITGGVAVTPEGAGIDMYGMYNPEDWPRLALIVRAVHDAGGLIAVQLFHGGRYSRSSETRRPPLAPSAVFCRMTGETPQAMSEDDLQRTLSAYASAARQARALGFDAIEIMGSEGYLLNEFLSPLTNRRTDALGGNAAKRLRYPLAVARIVKDAAGPDCPVIFRMSGQDFMDSEPSHEDVCTIAQSLEAAGIDALNVGVGWHESRVPTVAATVPRGAFAPIGRMIRGAVTIPVMGANRLNTPDIIQEVLENGSLDFISASRPWLADPAFGNKIRAVDPRPLNPCIACNQACLDHVLGRTPRPVSCLVNPSAGRELELLQNAGRALKIAVVGSGPAGLEAARRTAELGHDVTLYEKNSAIGGQLRLASRIPGKEEFSGTLAYFTAELSRLGVRVLVNHPADPDSLAGYDAVLAASGVTPAIPDIPGALDPIVATYQEILEGGRPLGLSIAIIGSGGVAIDIALYAARTRKPAPTVTMLSRSGRIGPHLGPTTRWIRMQELAQAGISIVRGARNIQIHPGGVTYDDDAGAHDVMAEQVILATGSQPAPLPATFPTRIAGGARSTEQLDAERAFREGLEAAESLVNSVPDTLEWRNSRE